MWKLICLLICVPLASSVAIYEQCGGEGYTGSTQCDAPLECYRRSRWYSSCQTACPGGDWECSAQSYVAPEEDLGGVAWGQCGGEGWTGATWCLQYECQMRSKWYSQCRPDCPEGWMCGSMEIPDVEVPQTDLDELDVYNPDDYPEDEELGTDEFPDPSEVDLDKLQQEEEALYGPFVYNEEDEIVSRKRRNTVRTTCNANGKSGTCIDIKTCKGTSIPGFCPGGTNIQCCVVSSTSTGSQSTGGLCGSYAKSSVSSIKGNGNVAYSVVKISRAHLVNPGSYSLSPTSSDNTMTKGTACAFDKMANAAKAAGVYIKIASGFRTVARQQYFWNCYITKRCNGGNLAARPGTSNHGRGAALDLNTNCGKQYGARPACGGSRVYQWLYKNAHKFGFTRTVKSEPWHWEFRGVGVGRASYS